jgi:hypothetical protein
MRCLASVYTSRGLVDKQIGLAMECEMDHRTRASEAIISRQG